MRPDAFSTCHPVVTFAFFASVIVLCVIVQQPALQAVGLVGAAIYHLVLRGRDAWRLLVGLALAFVILAAVNPLFYRPDNGLMHKLRILRGQHRYVGWYASCMEKVK